MSTHHRHCGVVEAGQLVLAELTLDRDAYDTAIDSLGDCPTCLGWAVRLLVVDRASDLRRLYGPPTMNTDGHVHGAVVDAAQASLLNAIDACGTHRHAA